MHFSNTLRSRSAEGVHAVKGWVSPGRLYLAHYHAERNHQGLDHKIIEPDPDVGKADGTIVCRERLGGLLKYYHRAA